MKRFFNRSVSYDILVIRDETVMGKDSLMRCMLDLFVKQLQREEIYVIWDGLCPSRKVWSKTLGNSQSYTPLQHNFQISVTTIFWVKIFDFAHACHTHFSCTLYTFQPSSLQEHPLCTSTLILTPEFTSWINNTGWRVHVLTLSAHNPA